MRVSTIWDVLRQVRDPELGDDLVSLGMVRSVGVERAGRSAEPEGDAGSGPPAWQVTVHLALTVASCPLRSEIQGEVERRLGSVPGVSHVLIEVVPMTGEERSAVMSRARWKARERPNRVTVPARTRVLAVASGKGGVGKSSISVNLAVALAGLGHRVGLLDADIWGFSVPRMLGVGGELQVRDSLIVPLVADVPRGELHVVSMGFLAGEEQAVMWRGLLLSRAVQQFLEDVAWPDIDYLVVDMPPGTGDVQMGLARLLPQAMVLLVTTPSLAAQKVAARVADMATKGYLGILGVVESMSTFACAHGESYALFGSGGGQRLADDLGVPLLASVPIDPELSSGNDSGQPAVLAGTGAGASALMELAEHIATRIVPPVSIAGCTARLAAALEAAAP